MMLTYMPEHVLQYIGMSHHLKYVDVHGFIKEIIIVGICHILRILLQDLRYIYTYPYLLIS